MFAELLVVILQLTTQMRLLNSKLNMHHSDGKQKVGEKRENIAITLYFYANRALSRILLER